MRPEDLLAWLRAAPFRPSRIHLASGHTHEIWHPEMLRVGRSSINVYSFAGQPMDPYERVKMVSLLVIERIEPVEESARAR